MASDFMLIDKELYGTVDFTDDTSMTVPYLKYKEKATNKYVRIPTHEYRRLYRTGLSKSDILTDYGQWYSKMSETRRLDERKRKRIFIRDFYGLLVYMEMGIPCMVFDEIMNYLRAYMKTNKKYPTIKLLRKILPAPIEMVVVARCTVDMREGKEPQKMLEKYCDKLRKGE